MIMRLIMGLFYVITIGLIVLFGAMSFTLCVLILKALINALSKSDRTRKRYRQK